MSSPPAPTQYLRLNGAHRGDTVYVIGAGPELSAIGEASRRRLGQRVCVGVNKTQYMVPLRYFLSAYIAEVLLARHAAPDARSLHMRPAYEAPLAPGVLPLQRRDFDPATILPDRFEPPAPVLYTLRNVALGATHLAHILGASRIAYVGVEQLDRLHFWHFEEAVRRRMIADLPILEGVPFLGVDHEYATYEGQLRKLERPAEESLGPFYEHSHADTFREYFRQLRGRGVELYTANPRSVVAEAGAVVLPLDELLDLPGG